MPLHFVDRHGSDGWIGDDLSVSYEGPEDAAGRVESAVDGAERRGREEDVLQELVVDLYAQMNIRKVERVDDSGFVLGR